MKNNLIMLAFAALFVATGCTPEIGSEKWCKMLSEKPKGEWTGNEIADYAKHCLLK